jgi:SNF2 family DNA or RNA helicase
VLGINSLTAFRATYVVYGGFENKQITGYKNTAHLERRVSAYSIRRKLKDCVDLPDKIYEVHAVELSKELRKLYNKMGHDLVVELKGMHTVEERLSDGTLKSRIVDASGRVVESATVLTKIMSLTQMTSGFLAVADEANPEVRKVIPLEEKPPKMEALLELVEALDPSEQVLVSCRFRWDVERVVQALSAYGKAEPFTGSTPQEDRARIVNGIADGSVRFMVGTPRTFGFGLNLTSIRHMVFYSHDYSLENRYQAEARVHRVGQDRTVIYHDLVCTHTIDEAMIESVRRKKHLLDVVMSSKGLESGVLGIDD